MDVMLAFPVLLLALGLGAACSLGDGCLDHPLFVLLLTLASRATTCTRGTRPSRALTRTDGPAPRARHRASSSPGWSSRLLSRGLIQPGLPVVIFVIVLAQWPYFARIIRGQVLSLREKEFIEAARSLGASNSRIIFREILPNLLAPIIVYTTLIIPTNILFEAALSFLGVGVQPPTATWGAMIAEATDIFDIAWWFMLAPVSRWCSPCWRSTSWATGSRMRSTPRATASRIPPLFLMTTLNRKDHAHAQSALQWTVARTLSVLALVAAGCGGTDDEGGGGSAGDAKGGAPTSASRAAT